MEQEGNSSRRRFLRAAAATSCVTGIAGCQGLLGSADDSSDGPDDEPTPTPTPDPTPSPTPRSTASSTAARRCEPAHQAPENDRGQVDSVSFRTVWELSRVFEVSGIRGQFYVRDNSEVWRVDRDGTEVWRRSISSEFNVNTPVDAACGIAAVGVDAAEYYPGWVSGLDAETGEELWTFETEYELVRFVTVVDAELALVGAWNGGDRSTRPHLYGVDPADGSELWRYEANPLSPCTNAIVTDQTIFAPANDTVHVLDRTGERVTNVDAITFDPVTSDGDHLFTAGPGIDAVDLDGRTVVWRTDVDGTIRGPPVPTGDAAIYAIDERLVAFDADEGTELWTRDFGERLLSSAGPWNGALVVGTKAGNVYAVDTDDGRPIGEFNVEGEDEIHQLALAGDTILAHDYGIRLAT